MHSLYPRCNICNDEMIDGESCLSCDSSAIEQMIYEEGRDLVTDDSPYWYPGTGLDDIEEY